MKKQFFLIIFSFLFSLVFASNYYWENPVNITNTEGRFPIVAEGNNISAVLWQEIETTSSDSGNIYLSIQVNVRGSWQTNRKFAGPFPYSGEVPAIASFIIDKENKIIITIASSLPGFFVYTSNDFGNNFTETRIETKGDTFLSPQIFQTTNENYLLLATKGESENFSLVYSNSNDAKTWDEVKIFSPTKDLRNAFLPSFVKFRNTNIIVLQAWHEHNNRFSYQLYSTISNDGGQTWSDAKLITSFLEPGMREENQNAEFFSWHNQRPFLKNIGNTIYLTWERGSVSTQQYAIYLAQLSGENYIPREIEKISLGRGDCYDPSIVNINNKPNIVWFDNRRGVNRIYMAEKQGFLWEEIELSKNNTDALFGRAVVVSGDLEVYWQQNIRGATNRIVKLAPDRTVSSPRIIANNYQIGKKSQNTSVRFTVRLPEDSSGIAGYNYAWGANSKPNVPMELQFLPEKNTINETAIEDGSWYLGVRALDYAGNWSEPTYIEFARDTTPPIPPKVLASDYDENGYFLSNTGKINWEPAEEDDIAGYTCSFEYIASINYLAVLQAKDEKFEVSQTKSPITLSSFDFQNIALKNFNIAKPSPSLKSSKGELSFTNIDNGIYALAVSAIDETGNIGNPTIKFYVFNKYIPYTTITYVDSKTDPSGITSLSIIGRGFLDGGYLNEIYIDRDGKEPWDLKLSYNKEDFKITNDRQVTNIVFSDLEEGTYRVLLNHTKRGLYTTRPLLSVTEYGTVKFGDFTYTYTPNWEVLPTVANRKITPAQVFIWSGIFFALVFLAFSVLGFAHTTQELVVIKKEIHGLITGEVMKKDRKKTSALRVKGIGLRFKLGFFTGTLVLSVVLIVSIPLGMQFSSNQEQTLAEGLESKVNVLLDSLASGARAYLPSQNILELGFLPDQISALSEAKSATITGYSADASKIGVNFVWATNDPEIQEVIDSPSLELGKSKLDRPENEEIQKVVDDLNEQALKSVKDISESISELTNEGRSLALKTDAASVQRRDEIQTITRQLEEKVNIELAQLANLGTSSYPKYNPSAISRETTDYTFYKPVLFRQGTDTKYVRGTVRIEISTQSLLEAVDKDRQILIQTTAIIALIAVAIGILGALILASIIISPVLKLAQHVAMIRDTEDKEELAGKDIEIRSKDEIGLLGETINDMTEGLVKAAEASKDLTVGKEVQKMFIPLETDSFGRKLTSGSSQEKHAHFFGYYEGAKGVSGDYFDYIKLDERHFAIIKCDVAGKGVPAALIMVEVATLFLDYFKDWTYKKNGYNLSYIVTRINDLIESRGFQGRFAAFTLCIFDSITGDVHFCNAGDNLINIYDNSTKKVKTFELPESSAAGVFPSDLVNMKGGFKVTKLNIKKGDILFLYTDGIEEAKRIFKDENLQVMVCAEPGLEKDEVHGNHSVGQDNEELGEGRVIEIIEAVLNKEKFKLEKWHNPIKDEPFEFDFSTSSGTIEEAILALVSVEKVFRMYQDPNADEFSRVQVDKKVNNFLLKHFKQYEIYCSSQRPHPQFDEYLYYTNIREDEQYDDLTLLAIKRI